MLTHIQSKQLMMGYHLTKHVLDQKNDCFFGSNSVQRSMASVSLVQTLFRQV
ncbi:hypothetical protein Hanom_Chr11g01010531 [Helianthus anomalus]